MKSGVTIKGDARFVRMVRELSAQVLSECIPVLEQSAGDTLSRARGLAPVETGELRASGKRQQTRRAKDRASAGVEFTHDFAAQIHEGFVFGRKTGPPSRFLTKAAKKERSRFKAALLKAVNSVLGGFRP